MDENLIKPDTPEAITTDEETNSGNSFNETNEELRAAKEMVEAQHATKFEKPKSTQSKLAVLALENANETTYEVDASTNVKSADVLENNSSYQKKSKLKLNSSWFKKFKPSKITTAIVLSVILCLVFGSALFVSRPTKTTSLDSAVTIGGVEVSQNKPDEAVAKLDEAVSRQKIKLVINGRTLETTAAEIGLSRNVVEAVSEAQNVSRSLIEQVGLKNKKTVNITLTTQVNRERLNSYIGSQLGNDLLAKDAQLLLQGEEFVVVPGQKGLSLDINDLVSQMNSTKLSDTPTITAKTVFIEPSITTEAAEKAKNEAYRLINPVYNVGHPSIGFKLIGMNLKTKWVVLSPDNSKQTINVAINKDQAQNDLEYLAKTFNRGNKDRVKVNIPGQATVVLDDGYDGLIMSQEDINKAKAELITNIDSQKAYDAVINPVFQPRNERVYDGQQKMVLIDITNFRAYAVENNQTIKSVPITSGKPGFGTPSGTFVIGRKTTVSTMSACSRGECWSVPNIKWQSYFTGDGHAIHATTANSAVGVKNISHGCVGMYEGDAKWFFDWAVPGTPVVIVR